MRTHRALLGASAILTTASLAAAQTTPVPYRLTGASTLQRGCFGPCACPAGPEVPIVGTFLLTPVPGPLSFDLYDMTDVDWTAKLGEDTLHFTGAGTYRVRTMGAPTQELVLDLIENGAKAEHYVSGEVPVSAKPPSIDIIIGVDGALCFNTFIHFVAEPIPPMVNYTLHKGSTWSRGCFGMCDCALRGPLEMNGTFALAFQEANPLYTTYSVHNIDWTVQDDLATHHITGSGTYTVGGEVAVTQRLLLDLVTDGEPAEHFDSGMVPGGAQFPAIEIEININGLQCYDTLIHVRAKPIGDFNLDGRVDALDLERFLACLTGPARALTDVSCSAADLDDDGDVDQADFGVLQRCITGPKGLIDPYCLK